MKLKLVLAIGAVGATLPATALVNLELRPTFSPANPLGGTVSLGLYAVASGSTNETIGALDVALAWDTTYLNPISAIGNGLDAGGPYTWFQSGFINPAPINASLSDGAALWTGLGQFLNPFVATPAGNRLATLQFTAIQKTPVGMPTAVKIMDSLDGIATVVYGGDGPNQNVTGTLNGATVEVVPEPATLAALAGGLLALRARRRKV